MLYLYVLNYGLSSGGVTLAVEGQKRYIFVKKSNIIICRFTAIALAVSSKHLKAPIQQYVNNSELG